MFCDLNTLRRRMNECGALKTPFLFAVDYHMRRAFFTDAPYGDSSVKWRIGNAGNAGGEAPAAAPYLNVVNPVGRREYARAFATVNYGLHRGDSFLVNLTAATEVECSPLEDIFLAADAPYRLLIPGEFVCFSPESFVRISPDGVISAFPMKGTIRADIPDARRLLEENPKELAEHYTIVDLLRNDLGMVARNVRVSRFRYFDLIATSRGPIYQTSSRIDGDLPAGWPSRLGDIILPMLPAGSICGAPKEATLEIIRRAETLERGWYTGVFGLFDGRSLDSAVMIRCIQRHADGRLMFHSGGGITSSSRMEDEYRELTDKIYLSTGG
ncbi:MAG: aminodeoxychorismate synthase component I [Muribaculaceae bacterium]|nr:aminodeoxychorismate synthase component I [Muribaculaceae bacterium]